MAHPMGEAKSGPLRVGFDRRLKLEFHGSQISSDGGLLPYRELDEALGLSALAGDALSEVRRGRNARHLLTGLLRQSIYGRLAGYEDVNDAERLAFDPVMRAIVDRCGLDGAAASSSQMGRFETAWLASDDNLAALTDLSGAWIDRARCGSKTIVLDIDSSVSPTHGDQEGSSYNGHFGCSCYHPLFVFNQFGDPERCGLRPGHVHSAEGWSMRTSSSGEVDHGPCRPGRRDRCLCVPSPAANLPCAGGRRGGIRRPAGEGNEACRTAAQRATASRSPATSKGGCSTGRMRHDSWAGISCGSNH